MVKISLVHDRGRAAAIADLARQTFALACPADADPADIEQHIAEQLSPERFAESISRPDHAVVCAEDERGPIAYSVLYDGDRPEPEADARLTLEPTVRLSKFYVLEASHGQGVAAQLMSATLDAARAFGARGVWLAVSQENARALRFYRKSGFESVGVRTFMLGTDLRDDFVLERPL